MDKHLRLSELKPQTMATIVDIEDRDSQVTLRLLELGIFIGEKIQILRSAPFNGPLQIELKGTSYACDRNTAKKIFVQELSCD